MKKSRDDPVEPGCSLPAEQDVARRLHQALALDDPLAVVAVPAGAEVRLEHRGLGLLDLQQERVVVVAAEHQHDPRPGPDAAHADDLAGDVDEPVALDEDPAIVRERRLVRPHQRVGGRP